jgi:hypothetical protein
VEFIRSVLAVLGAALPDAGATETHVEIVLRSGDEGALGTLTIRDGDGAGSRQRSVRGATCREAAEALALVLAQTIDPAAQVEPTPPTKAPPPPARPLGGARRTTPAARAPRRIAAPARPRRAPRHAVLASVGAALGPTPRIAPDVGIDVLLAVHDALPVEARLGAALRLPVTLERLEGEVRFLDARWRGALCVAPHLATAVTAGACAGAAVDWVLTESRGYRAAPSTTAAIPSAVAGVFGRLSLASHWSVGVETELAAVLVPTTWKLVGDEVVHETAPLLGRVSTFVAMNFP